MHNYSVSINRQLYCQLHPHTPAHTHTDSRVAGARFRFSPRNQDLWHFYYKNERRLLLWVAVKIIHGEGDVTGEGRHRGRGWVCCCAGCWLQRVAARLLTLKICSQARHGIIWTLTETASSLGSGFWCCRRRMQRKAHNSKKQQAVQRCGEGAAVLALGIYILIVFIVAVVAVGSQHSAMRCKSVRRTLERVCNSPF